jgi:alcohol dehydrogenase YqhD (iron-dependent ADH family)
MNNFVFENSTKVYFSKGCVKEYLANALSSYGNNVLLACSHGSYANRTEGA